MEVPDVYDIARTKKISDEDSLFSSNHQIMTIKADQDDDNQNVPVCVEEEESKYELVDGFEVEEFKSRNSLEVKLKQVNDELMSKVRKEENSSSEVSSRVQCDREMSSWVQCDRPECKKWRRVDHLDDSSLLSEQSKWDCSMNEDTLRNDCQMSQESYPEEDESSVYTAFTPGDLVMAKIPGYPWWPGIVEDDPDSESFFYVDNNEDKQKISYHVTFFAKVVSRAWLTEDYVTNFNGNEKLEDLGPLIFQRKNFKKKVLAAMQDAKHAMEMSEEKRIKRFGFLKRYKGADKPKQCEMNVSKSSKESSSSKTNSGKVQATSAEKTECQAKKVVAARENVKSKTKVDKKILHASFKKTKKNLERDDQSVTQSKSLKKAKRNDETKAVTKNKNKNEKNQPKSRDSLLSIVGKELSENERYAEEMMAKYTSAEVMAKFETTLSDISEKPKNEPKTKEGNIESVEESSIKEGREPHEMKSADDVVVANASDDVSVESRSKETKTEVTSSNSGYAGTKQKSMKGEKRTNEDKVGMNSSKKSKKASAEIPKDKKQGKQTSQEKKANDKKRKGEIAKKPVFGKKKKVCDGQGSSENNLQGSFHQSNSSSEKTKPTFKTSAANSTMAEPGRKDGKQFKAPVKPPKKAFSVPKNTENSSIAKKPTPTEQLDLPTETENISTACEASRPSHSEVLLLVSHSDILPSISTSDEHATNDNDNLEDVLSPLVNDVDLDMIMGEVDAISMATLNDSPEF